MKPIISVIVPVYKVERYLDRCVTSILNQTFSNFELILVNDGSPDNCPRKCDEWEKKDRRILVVHKENGGLSSARNAGLERISGQYVCFVDSDDWIDSHMLQSLYELLNEHPECDIAECDKMDAVSSKEQIVQPTLRVEVYDRDRMLRYFYRVDGEASNTQVWNKLIRTDILNDFRFVDTLNEDVEASYEFFTRARKMVKTNQKYYYYFKNNNGITRSKFCLKDLDYLNVWKRIVLRTKSEIPKYSYYAEMGLKRAYFTLLAKMFFRGYDKEDEEMKEMKRELQRNVINNFFDLVKWKMPISRKVLLIILVIW